MQVEDDFILGIDIPTGEVLQKCGDSLRGFCSGFLIGIARVDDPFEGQKSSLEFSPRAKRGRKLEQAVGWFAACKVAISGLSTR